MMVAVGPNTVGGDVPGGCVYVLQIQAVHLHLHIHFTFLLDGGATFTTKSTQNFQTM